MVCARRDVVPSSASSAATWRDRAGRSIGSGRVCGITLPAGLRESDAAARADLHAGHQGGDRATTEHLLRARWPRSSAPTSADELRGRSLDVYQPRGRATPRRAGIIIADTKFEWGAADGELILIDEVLTPDSSRFWPADQYQPAQPAVVRQAVRPRLAGNDRLGQEQPAAELPDDVVARTREKYIEAYERLAQPRSLGDKG